MAFDPQKDADLMRQKEAIRREKKRIQKLEEENRRRMLRLAQQEIAKKEKKEKREIASFFKGAVMQWHWVTYSCFDEALFLLFQYKY